MDRKLRCTRVAYIIRIIHFKDWSIIQLVFQCLWYSCFQDLQNNLANFPAAPKPIFDVSPTHLLILGEASGVISNEVGETSSGHQPSLSIVRRTLLNFQLVSSTNHANPSWCDFPGWWCAVHFIYTQPLSQLSATKCIPADHYKMQSGLTQEWLQDF